MLMMARMLVWALGSFLSFFPFFCLFIDQRSCLFDRWQL
jgi:hypothetical protein